MPHEVHIQPHEFHHDWKTVFLASWLKYPSIRRPDVLSVDIIRKEFNAEAGTLKTRRIIVFESVIPSWCAYFVPRGNMVCIEDSTINIKEKTYEMNTTNLTFVHLIKIDEKCFYKVADSNKDWTVLEQTGRATANLSRLSNKIEHYCADLAVKNSSKGRVVMEDAITRLQTLYKPDFE